MSAHQSRTDNESLCQTILTGSQDKALQRIQELREERKLADKSKRQLEDHLRTKMLLQDSTVATLKTQVHIRSHHTCSVKIFWGVSRIKNSQ